MDDGPLSTAWDDPQGEAPTDRGRARERSQARAQLQTSPDGRRHISPPYMAGGLFYLVCPNGCETVPLNVRSTISRPSGPYY
jgi:hypothetical protein